MPAARHGLVIGSVATSLAHVWAVRQKTSTEQSAAQVVDTIGALLQQRNLGTEQLRNQISGYASAAVTPGAANEFDTSLKAVVQSLETQTEQMIKDGQTATQTKLDTLFEGLEAANTAANDAKQTADADDKAWFECAADEKAKRQSAETACQLQRDDKDFAFDATGKYTLDFTCNFMTGDCGTSLQTSKKDPIEKMEHDATFALLEEQANYKSLKAACDAAEKAWSNQHAECKRLESQREASLCAFGSKAQAKCTAESEYTKLVSDTKQAQGGVHSEVDREAEWMASQTTKCMVGRVITRGLNSALDSVDMEACAAKVSFADGVGKLNTRQSELAKLAASNTCAAGPISFFNGEIWNIPTGAEPQSSAYTKAAFTPQLDPASGNFGFCSVSPPGNNPCLTHGKASCECFVHRDPKFCSTCAQDCGRCQAFCGFDEPH